MTHQCMAQRTKIAKRCSRNATKMIAPIRSPYRGESEPSIRTVHLCSMCARRLHSGVKAIVLLPDDGSEHTLFAGRGVGEIYCEEETGS